MATGSIILPIIGAILPDGSTNNAAAQFERVKSSAAAPSLHFVQLLFDPTTPEHAYWKFRVPANYAGGLVAKIQWKANATTGDVVWDVRLAAITPGDTDTPNEKALASANSATTTVNTTEARRLVETSITLTNADSAAAGDELTAMLRRDASNASDTLNSNDAEVTTFSLEYTTT